MTDLELVTTFRRDLHRIPEVDFDLPETIAYVRQVLEGLSCEIIEPCRSCVVAYFDVDAAAGREPGGATTAVRADMDALPISEHSGVPFSSTKPGQMHACGHDGHMAMALATACWVDDVLAGVRTGQDCPLPHNVLFVFQPAEETTGGALSVCESSVFEHYHVDRIFGFHVWPDLPEGVVATRPGPLLASSNQLTLTIHGTSSHIAKADKGNDALMAGARFLTGVEDLMAELSASEPCLLKFGHMTSGTVRNAISPLSVIEGSLRLYSDEMFDRAKAGVIEVADRACAAYGCTYDLDLERGYPPVVNDEELYEFVQGVLGDELGFVEQPLLIAEDFAFYQRHLPGLFMLLGTGTGIALHSDEFVMDEKVLVRGVETYRKLLQTP